MRLHKPTYWWRVDRVDRGVIVGDCFRATFYSFESSDYNLGFIKSASDAASFDPCRSRIASHRKASASKTRGGICATAILIAAHSPCSGASVTTKSGKAYSASAVHEKTTIVRRKRSESVSAASGRSQVTYQGKNQAASPISSVEKI